MILEVKQLKFLGLVIRTQRRGLIRKIQTGIMILSGQRQMLNLTWLLVKLEEWVALDLKLKQKNKRNS